MIPRRPASFLLSLLALPAAALLAGCSALNSISILPAQGAVVLTAVGQTAQFQAFGSSQMGSGSPTTSNISNSVTWAAGNPSVATINAAGLATAVGAGYTQIVASSGGISATSDLTVNIAGGGGTSGAPSITVVPGTAAATFVGETTQFLASGSLTAGGTPQNLTNQVQWVSSNVQVATVNSGGLATAVGSGTTTITAASGGVNGSGVLTVTISGASSQPTLAIIPTSANATFVGETTQFIALGNLIGSAGTQNLTGNVTWSSSDVSVATIDQNGLATAVEANIAQNSTTITAIGTTSTGSLISATSLLTVLSGGSVNLPTLAVYMAGTGTGTVTSSPGTIDCGSPAAGATCSGTFTLNTFVTLTATPASGSVFGGWSANCTAVIGNPNPLVCQVQMKNNETVGAIFNP
jgi:outer membrane biogenesis lipoprotein LolB